MGATGLPVFFFGFQLTGRSVIRFGYPANKDEEKTPHRDPWHSGGVRHMPKHESGNVDEIDNN
jgi:hypothetical protein